MPGQSTCRRPDREPADGVDYDDEFSYNTSTFRLYFRHLAEVINTYVLTRQL
jgi:hypothetical protein